MNLVASRPFTVVVQVSVSILLLCWCAVPAHAQRPGKFNIGVAATTVHPTDDDVRPTVGVGFTVTRIPRSGWGFTAGFNWFEPDIEGAFLGFAEQVGALRVRPVMGGPSYTFMHGSLATMLSVIGGPSFNRMRIHDNMRDRVELASDEKNVSVAIRPGVNLSYAVKPRVAITGFGGYMFNRPEFTFRTAAGEINNAWSADAVLVGVGVTVAVF